MKIIFTLTLALGLGACASNPDHYSAFGMHMYNNTPHEINWDEVDYIITETVKLHGGDSLRLRGFEMTIVETSYAPDDGRLVGGWTRVGEYDGEVAFPHGKCFSSTAMAHELVHILRGIHSSDGQHTNVMSWGALYLDERYKLIGVVDAVKRRAGKLYCGWDEGMLDTPGDRESLDD